MDMVVLAMLAMLVLAMLVLAMLVMLDTHMPMVLMAMPVLAMLAMLAMVDTPMPMEVTPMPMVPTATLDKKFILFLQLHSETIYCPRAYQLQQPQNDYHLQNLPHNQ